MIVRDRYSGLMRVYLTPDKTMKSAIKGIERGGSTPMGYVEKYALMEILLMARSSQPTVTA